MFQFGEVVRHHLLDETPGAVEQFAVVDDDFGDVGGQVVANRAHQQVAFLIDQARRGQVGRGGLNGRPQLQQEVQVPLQFLGTAVDAGGARNQRMLVADIQVGEDALQVAALFVGHAARDSAALGVVRHQHQETPGQTDEGGQRRAFAAALVLVDLHQHLLALADFLVDARAAERRFGIVLAEVAAVDFLHRQEALALGAVVDERRLQARLDAGDHAFVDVAFFLGAHRGFDVEVDELLAVDDGHAQLFRVGRV